MTDTIYLLILIALGIVVLFGDIKLADSLPKTKRRLIDKKDKLKKLLVVFFLFGIVSTANGQNLQFLYGYGNQKSVNIVTAEVYKPLDCGPLYYFTDFKFDNLGGNYEVYTEISKYWALGKTNTSLTAQYNVGIGSDGEYAIHIDPVYLLGISKAVKINEFNLSLDVLYRIDKFTQSDGVQLTFIFSRYWDKLQLSGYCDLWNSGVYDINSDATVVLFEPQVFYLISKRFSVGVEGRLSNYTLLAPYDNYIMAGLKWNLEN